MISKGSLEGLKLAIQDQLIEEVTPSYFLMGQELAEKKRALIERVRKLIELYQRESRALVLSYEEKEALIKEIVDEILGYGPIDDLMNDDTITEIMINGPSKVYVEKQGKKTLTKLRFENTSQLNRLIQKLISFAGRKVDETTPFVDAALENGARVNVILPPLSLGGPVVTIRKLSKDIVKIQDLVRLGTLTDEAGQFLIACVRARVNMIFSGPTGVGKTTTLGVLSYYISDQERIVVIEDTMELTFYQEHVVRLQARLPNIEGKGGVAIRDLLKNALRMRPERIIIGEVRGVEALDMLQAMASGHSGALGVIHAASPRNVISRLETMIATSGVNIPLWTIRKYIANNLNLIIQQERLQDGSRKIINITEVRGIEGEDILLEDIFSFVQEGFREDGTISGKIQTTGTVPLFLSQFKNKGIKLNPNIFAK